MINTILFDLDGTLVDTAPDLGYALNILLNRHGKPALSDAVIRPFASHGSRGLIGLGFGIKPEDASFLALRDEYLSIYNQVFTRSPILLEDISELLQVIEYKNLKWGIVTNKPRRFTQPLIKNMDLDRRAACVVSGDDAPQPKPSPATLLMACEQMQVKPENCIYIGDAERDIQAGKAAGMQTAVALFGYIDVTDNPQDWGADVMLQKPLDLLDLIGFCA
ncbi:MAG: HAD-IA family hydrolase [Pseudomonadota bacterium]